MMDKISLDVPHFATRHPDAGGSHEDEIPGDDPNPLGADIRRDGGAYVFDVLGAPRIRQPELREYLRTGQRKGMLHGPLSEAPTHHETLEIGIKMSLQSLQVQHRGVSLVACRIVSLPPEHTQPLIDEHKLFPQNGDICKPAALANLDLYWSAFYRVPNIPLRKDAKNTYRYVQKGLSLPAADISVRKIAKAVGSVQGELLEARQVVQIAHQMGYKAQAMAPRDLVELRRIVCEELVKQRPVMTCFTVNPTTGLPQGHYNDCEHAALIVGFESGSDTVSIAHWGTVFHGIRLADLHASMHCLPDVREQETYIKLPTAHRHQAGDKAYQRLKHDGAEHEANARLSLRPVRTGFRNALFLLQPDFAKPRWLSAMINPTPAQSNRPFISSGTVRQDG